MQDDIPEAFRSTVPEGAVARHQPLNPLLLWGGAGLVGLCLLGVGGWLLLSGLNQPTASTQREPTPATSTVSPTLAVDDPRLLQHFPYEEAPPASLEAVTADGGIQLRKPAARAFQRMAAQAQKAGVRLQALSGFRTVKQQNRLFFDVTRQRGQTVTTRAAVSAPPGHSEHHTGYAVDIGDATQPKTHVEESFADTAAFRWLQANAARYSFELSFPRDNPQGVSYEPWHWRYVGDQDSLKTFYSARKGQSTP